MNMKHEYKNWALSLLLGSKLQKDVMQMFPKLQKLSFKQNIERLIFVQFKCITGNHQIIFDHSD